MSFLLATWQTLLELSPWLLLGAGLAGLLHVALPTGFVHRHLGGRGGVWKAVLLGVPLPLCSCGVIPTGLGLKKDGASDGASVAFLVATPQTGVDSVLVSAGFLGWPFALFKVGAAAATGIAAGTLVDALGGDPGTAPEPHTEAELAHQAPAWRRAVEHADEVIENIWGWLVFGVLVSAALQTWLPADALAGTAASSGIVAGLVVLVASMPLYVCATASVPIAAGLIHAGLPPSAALVFLMAGPATNVATMGAVRGAFGMRTLLVYLGVTAVGSLGLGLLFDTVLPTTVMAHGAHEHTSMTAVLASVALVALFLRYGMRDLTARLRPTPTVTAATTEVEMPVGGMTCGGCAKKVDRALRDVEGVTDVIVALDVGLVTVRGQASADAMREAVVRAGFQA